MGYVGTKSFDTNGDVIQVALCQAYKCASFTTHLRIINTRSFISYVNAYYGFCRQEQTDGKPDTATKNEIEWSPNGHMQHKSPARESKDCCLQHQGLQSVDKFKKVVVRGHSPSGVGGRVQSVAPQHDDQAERYETKPQPDQVASIA